MPSLALAVQTVYQLLEDLTSDPASLTHRGVHRVARDDGEWLQLLGHLTNVGGHKDLLVDAFTRLKRQHRAESLDEILELILWDTPPKECDFAGIRAVPVHYQGAGSADQSACRRRNGLVELPSDLITRILRSYPRLQMCRLFLLFTNENSETMTSEAGILSSLITIVWTILMVIHVDRRT